jgi:hypothetical protein
MLRGALFGGAAALVLGCGGADLTLPSGSLPKAIAVVKGDNQTAVAGGILPESLVVRVTDASNGPVSQVRVAFAVLDASGGGRLAPDTAVTDAHGLAAARWILGTQAGTHRAQASVVGSDQLKATFTATARPGAPSRFALVSGDQQTAPAGSALSAPLVVQTLDGQGNPVAGVVVVWSVTGGGSVNPARAVTESDGRASTQRTLGPTAGTQTTVADAGDLPGSPITFRATATTGSAGQLAITTQPPASAVIGVVFSTQPQVQLRDNLGNSVAQAGIAVTAAIASGPAGGTLGGQLTRATDAAGLATFTDLALGGATGTYTLRFSGVNLASVVSIPVAVSTGAPSASRSSLTAVPTSIAVTGKSTVTVTVRDAQGNPIGHSAVVPAANDPAGSFAPSQAQTGDNGVATFSFSATKARSYTISAKADGITITQTATVEVTKVPTTTVITDDGQDPSFLTQPVTVKFRVTAQAGTPSGTVTVTDGSVSCNASVEAGQCTLLPTTAGTKTLTARYAGTDVFAASTGTASHQVVLIPTSTVITADDPDPSFPTQSVVVKFGVTGQLGTPVGTVTVSDGSARCSASVAAGQCALTPTTAGQKTITASYAGQSPFAASAGTTPHQVVLVPTQTQLSSSENPAPVGDNVQFTAQVSAGFGTLSGSVLFGDGGSCPAPTVVLGTRALDSSGQAKLSEKNLSEGAHSIVACYLGTTTFAASASPPLVQQITAKR